MSINKLKNIWVNNDTTNLQGTYGKVSILNDGKTELKSDTVIDTKLSINKDIDTVNDYKLDVNGNVNFTGNLYQNNALFSSGITLAQVQSNQNNFTNNFTVDNRGITGSNITYSSKSIILNTPNTNVADRSNSVVIKDDASRVYFSSNPSDLNSAYINPNSVTGYTYFNQGCVFQSGITLQTNGGVGGTLQVGTAYGGGRVYVYNGNIEIDTSLGTNKFKTNAIEPYTLSSVSTLYSTITNTLNIGNSINTYNVNMYGIWNVLGSIKSNSLTITPTQLGFLNLVSLNQIPTSAINGYGIGFLTSNITSNLTANSQTITPTELGYLSSVTSDIQTQINSKLGSTISQSITANSQSITPQQLGYLSGVTSNIQTQLSNRLTSTITQNITANSVVITPEQLSFLNRVLVSPSVNATLIPQSAISNVSDFVRVDSNVSITGLFSFSANPAFNVNAIQSACIDNETYFRFAETNRDTTIWNTYTFLGNPVFNSNAISDDYLSQNILDLTSASNNFMILYNQYISFNSIITGDIMNLINCNLKMTAGYNIDLNGASIQANGSTIGSVRLSYISTLTSNAQTQINSKLSTSTASTTYQTIANMASYLLSATASTTYQLISNMSNYLTTATADLTYKTINGNAYLTVITSNFTITAPYKDCYSVNNGSTAITITLPTITAANCGIGFLIRRVATSTTTVTFASGDGVQKIYNQNLTVSGATNNSILTSTVYSWKLQSMVASAGVYGWF